MTNSIIQTYTPPLGTTPSALHAFSKSALNRSAQIWMGLAIIGQWIFVAYIVSLYWGAIITNDLNAWNTMIPEGYVPNRTAGNLAVGIHVSLAVIIFIAGTIQFIPYIRTRYPRVHRWSGRSYVTTAIITSLAGLYMIVSRETTGGGLQRIGITVDALLIFVFSIIVWRTAIAREFDKHKRWVVRLFIVVSAVWFFRISIMAWVMILKAPVGFDIETFQGPFLDALSFLQYLIPLTFIELYFWAQRKNTALINIGVTSLIAFAILLTAVGIFTATMGMWLPKM